MTANHRHNRLIRHDEEKRRVGWRLLAGSVSNSAALPAALLRLDFRPSSYPVRQDQLSSYPVRLAIQLSSYPVQQHQLSRYPAAHPTDRAPPQSQTCRAPAGCG